MKIEPDMQSFQEALSRLAELQDKSMREVVLDQGALFCRDGMNLMPPFGKTPLKEPKGTQKQVGTIAILSQVARHIRGMDTAHGIRNPKVQDAFKKLARKRNTLAAEQMLAGVGFKRVAHVVDAPTQELHNASRNKRGRITKGVAQFFTWKTSAVERFKKTKLKNLGRAKAGWLVALSGINALRSKSTFKPPAWVARHTGEPGSFTNVGSDDKFGIVCTNAIPYAQKHVERIEREGWKARMIAAPKQAEAIYKGLLRKAKALKL